MSIAARLRAEFDAIDVYVFDQLLRGRITERDKVLDAGCGGGRNLAYLLRAGVDVWGVDRSPQAVEQTRGLAHGITPDLPTDRFAVADLQDLPFDAASFDVVLCCAVLHFAASEEAFLAMLDEMARVLRPGGLFFARLATSIGIEARIAYDGPGRYALPDGSERFLVDAADIERLTARMNGRLLDPIKTTNVQDQRCMTTWVVRRA